MKSTNRFQLLCVTMDQSDFSKVSEMNINSNVIFANQCDTTAFKEQIINGCVAKMISTQTRGVGVNRNLALCYADAEICLLADDDVCYIDELEEIVLQEFDSHPQADIIIFNLDTNSEKRRLLQYKKTLRIGKYQKHPWGAVRIAFRLNKVRKANIWFSTLFGGGARFSSGEDSMWIDEAYRKGLSVFVSKYSIGVVNMDDSSWFTGYNDKYYYSKGAFYQASYPKSALIWMIYFAIRTNSFSELSWADRIKWMNNGRYGYKNDLSYEDYLQY